MVPFMLLQLQLEDIACRESTDELVKHSGVERFNSSCICRVNWHVMA
jgi:hypothetical protein